MNAGPTLAVTHAPGHALGSPIGAFTVPPTEANVHLTSGNGTEAEDPMRNVFATGQQESRFNAPHGLALHVAQLCAFALERGIQTERASSS